ncbi:FAD-binding protein [Streptomyces sp. RerS4]|uniref:FAD-binding oxidoreductase n=1 Tax=Streptomyces sp. RerS4 TaxID=2942449 RepID=UPI00201C02FD|nr:FAD-binding protein [Streptomyces sp. RerS4]UQX05466.1 FAD-binding protein [Streptomyces sp. RerS4]
MTTRRRFLGSVAMATGIVAGFTGATLPARAAGLDEIETGAPGSRPVPAPEVVVRPGDPRYAELSTRGHNTRFVSTADEIWLVHCPAQVEKAVNQAIRGNQRITVRGGGHCFDGLVGDPQYRLLVDTSEMNAVTFDPWMNAFAVESGATLGHVYKTLYEGWGVTLPGGVCPEVGVGGHVSGGGYGPLSRRYGLSVDHLYAVEVVVAGANGLARTVVATSRPDDPHRDLWWAHTGAGGGQFGIVTKYWFRTPGATGRPGSLLPKPPATVRKAIVAWPWAQMQEANFTRLVMNHGAWHAANSSVSSPYATMHSSLQISPWFVGTINLDVTLDATRGDAQSLLDGYVAALSAGVGVQPTVTVKDLGWVEAATTPTLGYGQYSRHKSMGGYMRKPYTAAQVAQMYRAMSDPEHWGIGLIYLAAYGGKINTVSSSATAVAQRDSILKFWYSCNWEFPGQDEAEVQWVRDLHHAIHADTGGFPVPGAQTDGLYINYPDVDTQDPSVNTTGVPWSTLYHKGNYPRLQRVKKTYDPNDVFRHALSVKPA